jgi:proline dehydrogenase
MLASILPLMPKWIARPFARPYVAGESSDEALLQVKTINDRGFSATIDILGEHVTDKDRALSITNQYCHLYHQIDAYQLDCNISIKPTHVGLFISLAEAMVNITTILESAKNYNNFLRLDMENSLYTDQTFELFKHCKSTYNNVGVVLQSYLHRSLEDAKQLSAIDFNARICKGIYQEAEAIAFQGSEEIKENFMTLARALSAKGAYAGYATHDQDLIDQLLAWIESENIPPGKFEFQVLFGVPMAGRLEELRNQGYKIRVYVPFGPDWFDYSLRRLKENPDIIGYVIKNMFKSE